MLKWISDKLKGTISASYVKHFCEESFENFATNAYGAEQAAKFRNRYKEVFKQWKHEYLFRNIDEVFSAKTKRDQMLGLRMLVLDLGSEWVVAKEYLSPEYSDEDRKILSDKLFYKASKWVNDAGFEFCYLVNGAMAAILRIIADTHFHDATKRDYFQHYLYISRRYVEHLFKLTVSKAKGNTSREADDMISELAVEAYKDQKKQIYDNARSGGNYDWDETEEMQRREIERTTKKSDEPIKRDKIYPGEVKQIVEILCDRYERSKRGELYNVEGQVASDPSKFINIDFGLIWIALSENLVDKEVAEDAIREIIFQFCSQFQDPTTLPVKQSIPLEIERAILALSEENKRDGWFAHHLIALTRYLYNDQKDEVQRTREESKQLGLVSVKNGKDAWELYSKVMNMFGWEMNTEWLALEDEKKQSKAG